MADQTDEGKATLIVDPFFVTCEHRLVGGKGRNLWLLGQQVSCQVPEWFCVTTEAFDCFVQVGRSKWVGHVAT